jgi:hypothetical protein
MGVIRARSALRPFRRVLVYDPQLDGLADPGEVVWTWVTYQEDPTRGKDRPVLVVSRDGDRLLGLMLSSQRRRGRSANWLALHTGAWDRLRRPSWLRLDRVLELSESGIRREGAVLVRSEFDRVCAAMRSRGWTLGSD